MLQPSGSAHWSAFPTGCWHVRAVTQDQTLMWQAFDWQVVGGQSYTWDLTNANASMQ